MRSSDRSSNVGLGIASLFVFIVAAFSIFVVLAQAACRRHTVDACIPAGELLLGGLLGLAVAGWWLRVARRSSVGPVRASIVLVAALGTWSLFVWVLGSRVVCPPRSESYTCPQMTAIGVVALVAVSLAARRAVDRRPVDA